MTIYRTMPAAGRVSSRYADDLVRIRPDNAEHSVKCDADVLIIGAGPAGLSLGFELKRRGISFLIMEKGAGVGESWQNMPRQLKLVSPWKANSLPGTARNLFVRNYQISREEFLNYLRDYANEFQLPVRTDTAVESIERLRDEILCVHTSTGDFHSRAVVNATGYFSNPFVPVISGAAESRIPQLHAAEYRDPQQIAAILSGPSRAPETGSALPSSRRLILIVGKRLSAGQIMVELVQSGFDIALSHRSPIQYGAEPLAWWFLFRVFPALEWLKLKWKGSRAPSNDVRMAGGPARQMIQSGKIKTFPPIERFETDAVVFENGPCLKPDLVLYATGFRPALRHFASLDLCICPETGRPQLRELESVAVPGLFFLGLDHARNFQSRFIRGIRKDAAFLANRLQKVLLAARL